MTINSQENIQLAKADTKTMVITIEITTLESSIDQETENMMSRDTPEKEIQKVIDLVKIKDMVMNIEAEITNHGIHTEEDMIGKMIDTVTQEATTFLEELMMLLDKSMKDLEEILIETMLQHNLINSLNLLNLLNQLNQLRVKNQMINKNQLKLKLNKMMIKMKAMLMFQKETKKELIMRQLKRKVTMKKLTHKRKTNH